MPGTLRPFGGSTFSSECAALIVIVPGVGTEPVPAWKRGSVAHSLHHILKSATNDKAYVAWWDHEIHQSQALSVQTLHKSAEALREEIFRLYTRLPCRLCPTVFVGHSIGGILVKEALHCWDQSPSSRNEANLCVAGVILLGTPHTWIERRALGFCRLASLMLSANADSEYSTWLPALCREVESINAPTFSIYETEKTRLTVVKRDLVVEKELARIGTSNEQLWPAEAPHKGLCQFKLTKPMFDALSLFVVTGIETKWSIIQRPGIRRSSSSIISRPTFPEASSPDRLSLVESPVSSPSSSNPTSMSSSAVAGRLRADTSSSSASAPRQPPSRVEYKVPNKADLYFDKHDILKPVEQVLLHSKPWQDSPTSKDQIQGFALCGASGLGKSASAGHFVHKHKHRYGDIFWVSAEDTTKLFFAYTEIAFELHLADRSKPYDKFDCQKRVKDWFMSGSTRGQQGRGKWLLVFDNVTKPRDLEDFWPSHGFGDVLITTQCSLSEINDFSGQFGTEVKPFGKDVALDFLSTLTQEQINDPNQLTQARQIAEILGGSPLALLSLSSLIKQGRVDNDLVRKLTKRRESTESAQSRPDLSEEPLERLNLLVEPLLEALVLSRSLLDVIVLLDPDGIEEWILTNTASSMNLSGFPSDVTIYYAAKKELIRYKLVREVFGKEEIACDRMVGDIVRRRMGPERLQDVFEATVRMLFRLWPNMEMSVRHNKRRWGDADKLLRHVRKLQRLHEAPSIELDLSFGASILFAKLLNNAGWNLYERGEYEDAKSFADQARRIGEDIDEHDESIDQTSLLDLRSQVYYTLGAIAQITHDKRASLRHHAEMLMLRKTLESERRNGDSLLAHAYNEIGNDFMTDGEYDIAIGFYRTSIKIYESLQGFQKHWLALPLVNLGLAYWLRGDNKMAYDIVKEALDEQERAMGGPNDGLTMKTGRLLYAMGNITYSLGNDDESFRYHERALVQFESTLGSGHNRSCDVMWRLADHYARRGEYDSAINMLDKALGILWTRPLFERERGRLYFKRAVIMRRTREFSQPAQVQTYMSLATKIYHQYHPKQKRKHELTEKHFDNLVMFWSR